MKYLIERCYPYFWALVASGALRFLNINYIESENIYSALDGMITTTSLIIGFLGAVLPVIMSMKNDSKFVKYVFEKDTKQLFLKYMKTNLVMGIILIGISVSMYFKTQYIESFYYEHAFYIWVFACVSFLLCTYRCVNNMLNLIFSKDKVSEIKDTPSKTERENKFIEKLDNHNKLN